MHSFVHPSVLPSVCPPVCPVSHPLPSYKAPHWVPVWWMRKSSMPALVNHTASYWCIKQNTSNCNITSQNTGKLICCTLLPDVCPWLSQMYRIFINWLCDGMTVWQCDGVTVWGCDGMTVWRCDGVTVWWYEGMTVWQCDRVTASWRDDIVVGWW